MSRIKVIGLTGGIGAGKSTVSAYLRKKGCFVLDADQIARDLTRESSPVLKEIAQLFGSGILLANGQLDRNKLAQIIFSDRSQKTKLDNLLHHKVIQIMLSGIKEAESQGLSLVFADVPLLFESGFDQYTDEVWMVSASRQARLQRVMRRDGADEEAVRMRIRSQMDEAEKEKKADYILDNAGEKEALYEQIDRLLTILEKENSPFGRTGRERKPASHV